MSFRTVRRLMLNKKYRNKISLKVQEQLKNVKYIKGVLFKKYNFVFPCFFEPLELIL